MEPHQVSRPVSYNKNAPSTYHSPASTASTAAHRTSHNGTTCIRATIKTYITDTSMITMFLVWRGASQCEYIDKAIAYWDRYLGEDNSNTSDTSLPPRAQIPDTRNQLCFIPPEGFSSGVCQVEAQLTSASSEKCPPIWRR